MTHWRAIGLLALVVASPCDAQDPRPRQPLPISRSVSPASVTVGDPFTSMVRVGAPPGSTLEFHGLPIGDSVQAVDTVRIAARDDSTVVVAYRLVAWVAEDAFSAAPLLRVSYPDGGTAEYLLPLPLPEVVSVLPAGDDDLRPRPSRGVIRYEYAPWWPWAAAAAAAVALVGLTLLARWRWGRGRGASSGDPRAAALAALAELRRLGVVLDPVEIHAEATRILRRYLARLDPSWGREWTTSEIVPRVGARGTLEAEAAALQRLLTAADRVKFSGIRPTHADADTFVRAVEEWIDGFMPDATAAEPREAA